MIFFFLFSQVYWLLQDHWEIAPWKTMWQEIPTHLMWSWRVQIHNWSWLATGFVAVFCWQPAFFLTKALPFRTTQLWDVCSDQDALNLIAEEKDAEAMSKKLLIHALKNGSTDNISVMVILLWACRPCFCFSSLLQVGCFFSLFPLFPSTFLCVA